MLLTLILVFPAATLASWLPIRPRQASTLDDCTLTSTLPPVTLTSIYPASTIAGSGQGHVTGGGSLIYTTALPTLGPSGPGLHTYTITAPCPSADCQPPAATECPPGFTTAAVVCHVCGEIPVTTVLTLPSEIATASPNTASPNTDGSGDGSGDGSAGGSNGATACNGGSCAPGSAPTASGFIKSVRPTSLGHAKPTGPEAPGSNNAGASPSLPQSLSSPGSLHPQDTAGAADIPKHHPIPASPKSPSAPPSADSGSSPSSPETIEKPATVESPDAGSPHSPDKSEAHASPETPASSDTESSPEIVEKPATGENPGSGSTHSPKKPETDASHEIPASSDSESSNSSSSPSTRPDSSATNQHPENPKLPESPESPSSPTVPNSQKPATDQHSKNPDLPESPELPSSPAVPNSQKPATDSHDGPVGGGSVPEVAPSPEATPAAPTTVLVTGSAPGGRAARTAILGPLVLSFLLWLPLYIH
ncbi:hypothetical protein N0V84_008203 [Fusarium piperis]|uniref:Uncharacterized protein n=1 Tax=Fusarium piperis TaxID=1435070 RepID=A0A9W9BKD2_9HYPO|nr:hypothetical protein N0V84_008203 [Fusarium piperis]